MNRAEILHRIIDLERQARELEIDNQYADGLAYSQGKAKIREKYDELAKLRAAAKDLTHDQDHVQMP